MLSTGVSKLEPGYLDKHSAGWKDALNLNLPNLLLMV